MLSRTAMLQRAAEAKKVDLEEANQGFLRQAGIPRFGTAEEVADLMGFAVSPAAHWMTDTVLRMDGGEVRRSEFGPTLPGGHDVHA